MAGGVLADIGILGSARLRSFRAMEFSIAHLAGDSIHRGLCMTRPLVSMATTITRSAPITVPGVRAVITIRAFSAAVSAARFMKALADSRAVADWPVAASITGSAGVPVFVADSTVALAEADFTAGSVVADSAAAGNR